MGKIENSEFQLLDLQNKIKITKSQMDECKITLEKTKKENEAQEKVVKSTKTRERVFVITILIVCIIMFFSGIYVLNKTLLLHTVTKTTSQEFTIADPVCYITESGKKYHADGCQYLWHSQIETTLLKAKKMGYTACSRCNVSTTYYKQFDTSTREGNTPLAVVIMIPTSWIIFYLITKKQRRKVELLSSEFSKTKSFLSSENCRLSKLSEDCQRSIGLENSLEIKIADYINRKRALENKLKTETVEQLAGVPNGVVFNQDGLPINYVTVFTSPNGGKYHMRGGCSGSTTKMSLSNALEHKKEKCNKCGDIIPRLPKWAYDYRKLVDEIKDLGL